MGKSLPRNFQYYTDTNMNICGIITIKTMNLDIIKINSDLLFRCNAINDYLIKKSDNVLLILKILLELKHSKSSILVEGDRVIL